MIKSADMFGIGLQRLGKGSNGCVVNPPFECAAMRELRMKFPDETFVAKMFDNAEAAEAEMASGARVLAYDPEQRDSSVGLAMCSVPDEYAEAVRDTCEYDEVDKRQLVSIFAGKTLWDVAQAVDTVEVAVHLLRKLNDLMKWMARANRRGICHFDLKALNILYHNERFRAIDWGLAEDQPRLFRTKAPALYFPPDFHVARRINVNNKLKVRHKFTLESMEAETRSLLGQLYEYLNSTNMLLRFPIFLTQLTDPNVAEATLRTVQAFTPFADLPTPDAYQAFKASQKVDVYMFGFALVDFARATTPSLALDTLLQDVLMQVVLPMMNIDYTERISFERASTILDVYLRDFPASK
jgi:hypothetical protein